MGAVTSTALDLISGALRKLNVYAAGEPLSSTDANDSLQTLNDLFESLSNDKFYVYTANESIVAWTPGQFQYSIGNPTAGIFAGYTTAGSPVITGITAALNITFGINAVGATVGGTLTDTLASIPAGSAPSGTTIVSFNQGTTTAITFTGAPTGTSATLTSNWAGTTGLYLISFSDGEFRSANFTAGSANVTWTVALTGTPTAGGNTVNTTTLTMSANAISTLTSPDQITYTAPGNFALPRPLRFRPGYTRITTSGNTGLDYWWDVCSLDDYNEVGYKGVPGPWPYMVCYQDTFPYGTIWVYPNPQVAGQVFLWTDVILQDLTSLTQTFSLPQGYSRSIKTLLALELAPEYGKNPSAELMRQANEARSFIRAKNQVPVKKLRYDSAIMAGNGKDASFILHGGFGSNL